MLLLRRQICSTHRGYEAVKRIAVKWGLLTLKPVVRQPVAWHSIKLPFAWRERGWVRKPQLAIQADQLTSHK